MCCEFAVYVIVYQLRQLRVIRGSLSTETCTALVHAFVSSIGWTVTVFSWSRLLVPPLSRAVLFRGGSLDLEWAPFSTSDFAYSLVTCVFSQLKTALFSRAGVGSASE